MTKKIMLVLAMASNIAFADTSVSMSLVDDKGTGENVGQITITESKYGLVFTPNLKGLASGIHGFHLHQYASCQPKAKDEKMIAAGEAGGHYDPAATKQHGYPWNDNSHLGDLPALYVNADGVATQAVLAPRLKVSDLKNRSLMIHMGGDNHADHPSALGGGGMRVACGVIKE